MPVPALGYPGSLGVSEEAVLLLPSPEVDQPPSVQLALSPRLLPGHLNLREQILVTLLTVRVLPLWGGGTERCRDQTAEDKEHQHFKNIFTNCED